MADFGIVTIPTHYTIQPVDFARWMEDNGFESLFFGEHSHIPTSRESQFPGGGGLPQYYKEFFDPFVGLSAAAAVTTTLQGWHLSLLSAGTQPDYFGQASCMCGSGGQWAFFIWYRRWLECRRNGRSRRSI